MNSSSQSKETAKGNGKLEITQKPKQNLTSKSSPSQQFSFHTQVAEDHRPLNSLNGFQGKTGSLGKGLSGQVGSTNPLGKEIGGRAGSTNLFSKELAGTAPFLNKDGIGQNMTDSLTKGASAQNTLTGTLAKSATPQSTLTGALAKSATPQSALTGTLAKSATSQSTLTGALAKQETTQTSPVSSLTKRVVAQSGTMNPFLKENTRPFGVANSSGNALTGQTSNTREVFPTHSSSSELSMTGATENLGKSSPPQGNTSVSEPILPKQVPPNQSSSWGLQTTGQTRSSQSLSNYPGSFGQISSNDQKLFSTGYSVSPVVNQSDPINHVEPFQSEPMESSKPIEDKPLEDSSEPPGTLSSAIPVRRWFVTLMCMNIPIIGWIYLIILACSRSKGARRDFAKAYLLYKLLFLLISAVILAVAIRYGLELLDVLLSYMDML